jgi:hypothetical protein
MKSTRQTRTASVKSSRAAKNGGVLDRAEWEKCKGSTRNVSPHEAALESDYLSAQYRRMHSHMASFTTDLNKVLRHLRARKVPFVLTGAHAIGTWTGRPRATKDIEFLVKSGRNHARAIKAIQELYPELEMRNFAGVAAFFVPGETESVIDVTYPHREDIAETLETAVWVEEKGQRYRVPTLEGALANKYGAMLTPTRNLGKRTQDMADFYYMVQLSMQEGRQPIDLARLQTLGEKVWAGGGGKEILALVEQAKVDKLPSIQELVQKGPAGEKAE